MALRLDKLKNNKIALAVIILTVHSLLSGSVSNLFAATMPALVYYLVFYLFSNQTSLYSKLFITVSSYAWWFGLGASYWLPMAIKNITGASGLFVGLTYFVVVGLTGLLSVGILLPFVLNIRKAFRPIVAAVGWTATTSSFSSLLHMNSGEFLAQYSLFDPFFSFFGSLGFCVLWTLMLIYLVELAVAPRKTLKILWPSSLLVSIFFIFLIFLPQPQQPVPEPGELKVMAVQTELAHYEEKEADNKLLEFIHKNKDPKTDLIITSESAWSKNPGRPWSEAQADRWSHRHQVELKNYLLGNQVGLLGAFRDYVNRRARDLNEDRGVGRSISSFLFTRGGRIVDRVVKANLIPFIEMNPLGEALPFTDKIFYWTFGITEKVQRHSVRFEGFSLASMVCYDSLFRSSFWKALNEKAHSAVVMSNDTVLGETGANYHVTVTRARAIEYGVPTVFVGRTGLTGLVNQNQLLGWDEYGVKHLHLKKWQSGSFYSSYLGSWMELPFTALGILLCVGLSLYWVIFFFKALVKGKYKRLGQALLGVFTAISILTFVTSFIATVIYIPTESMAPTINKGDRVLLCKWPLVVSRNTIVSYVPHRTGPPLFKRVVFVPGDKYEVSAEGARLNGEWLVSKEDWNPKEWPDFNFELKENEYFMMGDNRLDSHDSRFHGPISLEKVVGWVCGPH